MSDVIHMNNSRPVPGKEAAQGTNSQLFLGIQKITGASFPLFISTFFLPSLRTTTAHNNIATNAYEYIGIWVGTLK